MNVYIIGSLKNPAVPETAMVLRTTGHDVFDDWHAPGPDTDDYWQAYEQARGRDYLTALGGKHADNVFAFDRRHLLLADAVVLVLPAGKSAHLELGFAIGHGKEGYIILGEEPERWDVMYRFADKVFMTVDDLVEYWSTYDRPD